ncbi:hypothetical protein F4808DRAFT_442604 [Astrocystis sublimbata]|nr:hypothetical protein F4808DRAFT_442604 [Astrocystis sublimbata]
MSSYRFCPVPWGVYGDEATNVPYNTQRSSEWIADVSRQVSAAYPRSSTVKNLFTSGAYGVRSGHREDGYANSGPVVVRPLPCRPDHDAECPPDLIDPALLVLPLAYDPEPFGRALRGDFSQVQAESFFGIPDNRRPNISADDQMLEDFTTLLEPEYAEPVPQPPRGRDWVAKLELACENSGPGPAIEPQPEAADQGPTLEEPHADILRHANEDRQLEALQVALDLAMPVIMGEFSPGNENICTAMLQLHPYSQNTVPTIMFLMAEWQPVEEVRYKAFFLVREMSIYYGRLPFPDRIDVMEFGFAGDRVLLISENFEDRMDDSDGPKMCVRKKVVEQLEAKNTGAEGLAAFVMEDDFLMDVDNDFLMEEDVEMEDADDGFADSGCVMDG